MSNTVNVTGNHILVGLGGTGGKILRAFKMRMFEEFPTAEARGKQPVSILYVDSTDEMMPKDGRPSADFKVMGQDASFRNNEFLNIKAVDVNYILEHIDNYPNLRGIVDNAAAVKTAIGALGEAAGQKRRAGRLLFAANASGFVNSLRNAYARAVEVSGNAAFTTFYIFAGLCGGTGSGSIIDAIVLTRKTYPNAKILVYAMMPEMDLPKPDIDQGRYYPNGYAALNELNALQSGRWSPWDVEDGGTASYYSDEIHGVANGLTVYSNMNENGIVVNSFKELPKIVSDMVFARIFCINTTNLDTESIIHAFNYENMSNFEVEYDETASAGLDGRVPVARTKKVNSFGIKRVIYPELRVLKHITYTLGESVLYQFKYNNWRENLGYVNEERNKDYRREYLSKENQQAWMLDMAHLMLEQKILESDTDYPTFDDYWHDKAVGYAEEAKKNDNPLNELDNILGVFFTSHFREDGVEAFYSAKERAIPDMAKEVRRNIEHGLFEKWKLGDMSIVELQMVSRLLIERMGEIRTEIETAIKNEKDNCKAVDEDRIANVQEWSRLGLLQRMVGAGARRFAEHQNFLADYYISKTRLVALEFAKKLAAKIFVEIGKLDEDISAFAKKISDAIEETEKLVTAQRKVNKGLEDLRGAIIEVSEEKAMADFEADVKTDKIDMPNIARQIREAILPEGEFVNFGRLSTQIDIDDIKDTFDVKLAKIVRAKHSEKADAEKKVLGLNILAQLRQKLTTDEDINVFAHKIVQQSGVFLLRNNNQMRLQLRNNEGDLSPTNPASINKKAILVSIPSPEGNEALVRFAARLKQAFMDAIRQGNETTSITVSTSSPRKDELLVISFSYCYPLRCAEWLGEYRRRYERFLNTGNKNTDRSNSILLHSETDGSYCPPLFAVEKSKSAPAAVPPPMPGAVPPPMAAEPEISLHIAVNGQQYGPFNREQCREMVKSRQLTPQSTVWMQGLPAWTPAEQVEALKPLFAPQTPPDMPPMPLSMPPAL